MLQLSSKRGPNRIGHSTVKQQTCAQRLILLQKLRLGAASQQCEAEWREGVPVTGSVRVEAPPGTVD